MSAVADMQDQLAKLRSLRADGVRKSRFGDDEIEFRSDTELAAAIADLERRIAATSGGNRITNIQGVKGYRR